MGWSEILQVCSKRTEVIILKHNKINKIKAAYGILCNLHEHSLITF